MKAPNNITLIFIVLSLFQTSFDALAQNSKTEKHYINNNRHWLAEIPIWVPGFRGQIAYGDFNFSSSESTNEREFNRIDSEAGLEFYFVGRIAAKYNKIWVQADAFSGEVGSTFNYTPRVVNGEKELVYMKVQGTIPRLVFGYSVWEKVTKSKFKFELIPYIGVRYVGLHLKSDVFDSTNVIDLKSNWLEPVIGIYAPVIYKRFKIEIQADYGTTNTKNSWVISNRYRYSISKLVDVQLGWNYIRLYHKGIVDSQELESTIKLFGPTAGIGFRF